MWSPTIPRWRKATTVLIAATALLGLIGLPTLAAAHQFSHHDCDAGPGAADHQCSICAALSHLAADLASWDLCLIAPPGRPAAEGRATAAACPSRASLLGARAPPCLI